MGHSTKTPNKTIAGLKNNQAVSVSERDEERANFISLEVAVGFANVSLLSCANGFMTSSLLSDLASQSLCSPPMPSCPGQEEHPIKIGVLASGSGSNFEAIAQAITQHHLSAQVEVLIYNNPQAKVVVRSQHYNIPAQLLNHRDFSSREALDQAIVERLQNDGVELVVMAGWMRVVTPVLLEAFPNRVLNIHPSLLPSFKGMRAVEQAIAAGVKITGCTAHWVVPEVDSGEILVQAAVPVLADDTPDTLHARIQVQEHRVIVAAIAQANLQIKQKKIR
jgi:phosphoribosylglycinamide formyltransferase 1